MLWCSVLYKWQVIYSVLIYTCYIYIYIHIDSCTTQEICQNMPSTLAPKRSSKRRSPKVHWLCAALGPGGGLHHQDLPASCATWSGHFWSKELAVLDFMVKKKVIFGYHMKSSHYFHFWIQILYFLSDQTSPKHSTVHLRVMLIATFVHFGHGDKFWSNGNRTMLWSGVQHISFMFRICSHHTLKQHICNVTYGYVRSITLVYVTYKYICDRKLAVHFVYRATFPFLLYELYCMDAWCKWYVKTANTL